MTTIFLDQVTVHHNLTAYRDIYVDDDIYVQDDLDVSSNALAWSLDTDNYIAVGGNAYLCSDVFTSGKVYSTGGYDPPYVLYDGQTRQEVIDRIKQEVPASKQGGAALFFNRETKRLEIYVGSEGVFYDLQGKTLHQLSVPQGSSTFYKNRYYLNPRTGKADYFTESVQPIHRIRNGYALDPETGQFVSDVTGQAVGREQAVECYSPGDKTTYSLQGEVLRQDAEAAKVYVTEYYFDSHSGRILSRRQEVHDRYMIKKGYALDEHTGQFIDEKTGVPADQATVVAVVKAADRVKDLQER